jgi:hypothetical protein
VQAHDKTHTNGLNTLEKLFATPDDKLDLAVAKIRIDKLIDPSINVYATIHQIKRMANTVKQAQTPNMSEQDKLLSLSAYLYESGNWNNNQPFAYDLQDPLGETLKTKMLSTYLNTKQGNCISMPILYMLMAEKIGVENVTLSTAPLHVFVQHRDNKGNTYQIETTSGGGFVNKDYYRRKADIKNKAIKNNVYLSYLTKKESLAVMSMLLVEYYEETQQWQTSIDVANLALQHYPNYAYAMVKAGNGHQRLLNQTLRQVRAKGFYTDTEKQQMDNHYQQNNHWFASAENLGWQMPSQKEQERYLQTVRQEINNQQRGKS